MNELNLDAFTLMNGSSVPGTFDHVRALSSHDMEVLISNIGSEAILHTFQVECINTFI